MYSTKKSTRNSMAEEAEVLLSRIKRFARTSQQFGNCPMKLADNLITIT